MRVPDFRSFGPIFGALVALCAPAAASPEVPPEVVSRVVTDAGHGGPNLGAQGAVESLREKNLTLSHATQVAAKLRARSIDVTMTRTTDRTQTLRQRVAVANK